MTTPTNSNAETPPSPAALQARSSIAADLYREGRITRAECFRLAVDASIGQDSGQIEYEVNDDHQFMMTGEGVDHDEYRRREEIYQANVEVTHGCKPLSPPACSLLCFPLAAVDWSQWDLMLCLAVGVVVVSCGVAVLGAVIGVSKSSAEKMKTLTICPNCNNGIRADGLMECNACYGRGKIEIDTGDGVSDNEPAYECCDICEGSGWVGYARRLESERDKALKALSDIEEQMKKLREENPAPTMQYTGHVPCRKCGKTHWMHGPCPSKPNT